MPSLQLRLHRWWQGFKFQHLIANDPEDTALTVTELEAMAERKRMLDELRERMAAERTRLLAEIGTLSGMQAMMALRLVLEGNTLDKAISVAKSSTIGC